MTSGRDDHASGGRDPFEIDLEAEALPPAPAPSEAPPPPEPEEARGPEAGGPAAERALKSAARSRTAGVGALFVGAAGGLIAMAISVSVVDFVAGLFARSQILGWVGLALLALLIGAILSLVLREVAALGRLRRIDEVQRLAVSAEVADGPGPARRLVAGLRRLYGARPEARVGLDELEARAAELVDGEDIRALAEARLMPALDAEAERAVVRASRTVAAATAFVPITALDVLVVLQQNAAMIRRIAEIYGGRAGWLGSLRLLRSVAQHLAATGAIAATDDLLGPLVGGGVLGKLSRRFGEAAINAALTARVGTAAIEVCRPMAFRERRAPKARSLVLDALSGWRSR